MNGCEGTLLKTSEPCGRKLFRCKKCEHVGCNQAARYCDRQGFVNGRCQGCNRLGFFAPMEEDGHA
jgi:hypothetical protein